MAVVACGCGAVYGFDGSLGQCPHCAEVATLPHVTDREAREMEYELKLVIEGVGDDLRPR